MFKLWKDLQIGRLFLIFFSPFPSLIKFDLRFIKINKKLFCIIRNDKNWDKKGNELIDFYSNCNQPFFVIWVSVLTKYSLTDLVLFWLYIDIEFLFVPSAVVIGRVSFSAPGLTYLFLYSIDESLQCKDQCFVRLFSVGKRIFSKCWLPRMNGSFSFKFVRCVRILLRFCSDCTLWPCLRGTCSVSWDQWLFFGWISGRFQVRRLSFSAIKFICLFRSFCQTVWGTLRGRWWAPFRGFIFFQYGLKKSWLI